MSTQKVTTIKYDFKDCFAPYPTPLVAVSTENIFYGEKWGQRDILTINGKITGCTLAAIYSGYSLIKENFAKSYQTFSIEQGSSTIYSAQVAELQSFNISKKSWVGEVDYEMSLDCYQSNYFSGAYGILEPVKQWSITKNQDYRGLITHEISCRGFNTSNSINNALDNAKSWVIQNRASNSFIQPIFIGNISTGKLYLMESAESIDRFNGTYSITDTYQTDLTRTGFGILRYTTSLESGANAISSTVNGEVEFYNQDITGARQIFNSLDKYGTALLVYEKVFKKKDLNPYYLTSNVTEDIPNSNIKFAYKYDNSNLPPVYFDYSVTLTSGESISASIQGNVVSRSGDINTRTRTAIDFSTGINLYQLAADQYRDYYSDYAKYPLSFYNTSLSKSIDEFNGTVSLSAEFNNNLYISGLKKIEKTVSFLPQLRKFDSQPIITGLGTYSVIDLGYSNRAELSINGSATIDDGVTAAEGLGILKKEINRSFKQFGSTEEAALERNNFSFSRYDDKLVNFDVSWSFASKHEVIKDAEYSKVDILLL